jgi:hypothetical protein
MIRGLTAGRSFSRPPQVAGAGSQLPARSGAAAPAPPRVPTPILSPDQVARRARIRLLYRQFDTPRRLSPQSEAYRTLVDQIQAESAAFLRNEPLPDVVADLTPDRSLEGELAFHRRKVLILEQTLQQRQKA